MTITVKLSRKGKSRSAFAPIEAQIVSGSFTGKDILSPRKFTDLDCAKRFVDNWLVEVYKNQPIDIEWTGDALESPTATHDIEMGQWKAGQAQGLLDRTRPLSAEKARKK